MNIVYLCNKKYYLNKMSRVRFHSIKALSKTCEVFWGGPEWENWDDNKSVDENLQINNITPDLIIAYKPLEIKGFAESSFKKCIRYNEMHDEKWTAKEINDSNSDIVVCHHKNDLIEWQSKTHLLNRSDISFINVPHCAEKTIFKDYGLERTVDILLVGALNVKFYPLRQKMIEVLMEMSNDYKVAVYQHPGYDLSDAHTDRYAIELAKAINSAKICLTCSGSGRWRFGKYVEIPSCRTAIAGDIPDDEAVHFQQFIIEINLEDSVSQIVEKLKKYLDNQEKLDRITDKGWLLSKKYSQELYAGIFIEKIKNILNEK